MKKILIDANPVVPYYALGRNTGIGRTCMELVAELDKMRDALPFQIELFTQNLKGVTAARMGTGFKSRHVYLRHTDRGVMWAKRLRLRELLTRYDLQHITHNFENVVDPSRCIATVHDAFFMKIDVDNFDYSTFRRQYPTFINACRHIITCSENSRDDIVETMGVDSEKITVIPWGVDHGNFFVEPDKELVRDKLREELGLANPYILSVSCDAGRKRTPELIKAWLALDNPVNDLVLVWGNPPAEVKEMVNGNPRVHFLSGISNEQLRLLYNGATISVNPTSYEGFGLPILEAMACGCPAVTCRNSSLPEVGADIALYLEEPVSESLPPLLAAVDRGEIDLTDARARGPRQAARFTWRRTAEETVKVYAAALGINL